MKNNDNKVSILIPVYREPLEFIKESVYSILQQTYQNIEVLVGVDDPNNYEIIDFLNNTSAKNYNFKVYLNEVNKGLAWNLNNLLEHAQGEYIARMDADDVSDGLRIEKQVEFLKSHNLNFVSGAYDSIDENGKLIKKAKKKNLLNADIRRIEKYGNILTHPLWLVSKEIMVEFKYRAVEPVEDYDLIARAMLDDNVKFGFMGQSLLKYRVRNKSESHRNPIQSLLMTNVVSHSIKNNFYPSVLDLNDIKNNNNKKLKWFKIRRMFQLLKYKVVSIYINNKVNKIE